jgi:hypothetical protein
MYSMVLSMNPISSLKPCFPSKALLEYFFLMKKARNLLEATPLRIRGDA